jgi:hypothetical protein
MVFVPPVPMTTTAPPLPAGGVVVDPPEPVGAVVPPPLPTGGAVTPPPLPVGTVVPPPLPLPLPAGVPFVSLDEEHAIAVREARLTRAVA